MPDRDTLMLQHWIQQSAEVRYTVLASAKVPVSWGVKRAEDLESTTEGRTWLLVHRSGYPCFEKEQLLDLLAAMAQKLGPPEPRTFTMTRGETIKAYRYALPQDRESRRSLATGTNPTR